MSVRSPDLPPTADRGPGRDDRLVAVLCYLTPAGFVLAVLLHGSRSTALGAFHLRQALGLLISFLLLATPAFVLGNIFAPTPSPLDAILPLVVLAGVALVFAMCGVIAAAERKRIPLPIIGRAIAKRLEHTFT